MNLIPPKPGDTGMFHCLACGEWFVGKLEKRGILDAIFLKGLCKSPCCPVCRSKNTIRIPPCGEYM
ncbi:hypothetical protein HMPREF1222_00973 [Treponema vincentii F0403]|uniref:Uncharacterized protein n=1 Tax=Treponema vincentii F0403 TaxID=1125702 RepID=S3MDP0_9SPIR|nr:hypothetical protein [Treponema vincentii]EPF47154.1 hypothetical protein HMPREF1222_00973 [Treponema vincentii F0403]